METKHKKLKLFGIIDLIPYLKPYRGLLIRMVALGLCVSMCDSLYPLFNRYAINHFLGLGTLDTLPLFLALMLVLVAFQAVTNYINVNDCAKIEMYLDRDLRNNAFRHLQEVSLSYFNQNTVGYIHARAISDSGKIGEMIAWKVMEVFWYGSYILLSLGVMYLVNVKLALVITCVIPAAVLLMALFQKKLTGLNRQGREQNSIITSDINEGITGAKTIRTLSVEEKMTGNFLKDTAIMKKIAVRTGHYSALWTAVVSLLGSVALCFVVRRGGHMVTEEIIAVGTLSVFMSYALNMLDPIQSIVQSISGMIAIQVNIERYLKLMEERGEVYDRADVIEKYGDAFHEKKENWEPLFGDIEFRDVTFHYPDGEELVLEHFNLFVKAGESVAIVGETGAGKSTLVNLVCRFFEPTTGCVLVDGRDVKDRSLGWLHANLGYVLQNSRLFSGTVRENLSYGRTDVSDEEITTVLEQIAPGFLQEKLPKGLDTEVGEGGDFLSAGEKQLLAIARALLADPKILILDEATAAVDSVTEQRIQDAIALAVRDRTSFIIAHRLSTIVHADRILLVEDGRIAESGTHKELMEARGRYYRLFTRQFEETVGRTGH